MNVQQTMEDVHQMHYVQILKEVLVVLVKMVLMEMVLIVLVIIFFFLLEIELMLIYT